jgi:acyl-CoA thioester hydrolase
MRNDPRRRDLATYPWSAPLETRFTDMDVNHHLNNVAVSRLYEEGRVRFNQQLREAHPELRDVHYLVGHVAIDYLAEGHYPDPVTIGYGVHSLGNTSYRAAMGMFQRGLCIGLCDTVMVHRGPDGPSPLPGALRVVLGEWVLRP